MLHGTCGELPGGAGLGVAPARDELHALYKPGAALVGAGAGQGCAEGDEEDARCRGTVPGTSLGSRMCRSLRGGAQLAGLPSIIGLGARLRSCRRDTWEERCGRSGPSFKASLVSRQQSPRRQCRGSSPSLRGQGGSGIPMGAGVEALSLLCWINPLMGNLGTPRLSSPHGYGGIPKG